MIKQRVDGDLHRSLPATLKVRADDDVESDLLKLRMSVASDTPILRSSYFDEPWVETLGMRETECDMSRLNDGAPVLANHDRYTASGKTPLAGIGTVEKAWLEDGKLMADIVLSRRESLSDLRQDIADGLVRNVSIGYRINERVLTKAASNNKPNEYRVSSWTVFEVSLVDVPADANVGMGRSEDAPRTQYRVVDLPAEGITLGEVKMIEETTAPATIKVADKPIEKPIAGIREAAKVAGFGADVALDMIERGLTIDQSREELFKMLAEKVNVHPTRQTHVEITVDETDTRRTLMTEAMNHRLSPKEKLSDGAREYRGMSLLRMAEESLEKSGVSTRGMSAMQIASRSLMATSDFPLLLSNLANKSLRTAYQAAPVTYQRWARRASNAANFKSRSVIQLGGMPDLRAKNEHGEFTFGVIGEGSESYKVVTYGRVVGFTRESIVNDDLDGFGRVIAGFGASAARLENRTVYKQLTDNAAMADGIALFHASHGNLAGAGAVISAATLGAGRAAMRKQKGLASEELNITPSYLLVPTDLEQTAYQFTSTQYVPATTSAINEFRSGGRTAIEPIVDPVLDVSATAWYLVGDGVSCDTVDYCWLDGNEGVYIEQEMGFEMDGIKIKARLDFATKAIDWRGVYRNAGA